MKINLKETERFKGVGYNGLQFKGQGFSYYSILNNIDKFENDVNLDGGTFEEKPELTSFLKTIKPQDSSLILTPNAYKENKLYSFRGEDFNFTRNTTATRVNENGFIEVVNENVPRIDYSTGSSSILIEPQRTNLFPDSQPTESLPYSNSRSATFVNYDWGLGSDFNNTAIYFEANNTGIRYFYIVLPTPIENTTVYLSFYMRFENGQEPNPGSSTTGNFNIIGINPIYVSYKHIKNGIYKIIAKKTVFTSRTIIGGPALYLNTPTHNTSFWISGIQVEEGEYPTSYIPTNGSIVTRNLDNIVTKDFNENLVEKGDDFKVNMRFEMLNESANDIYGRLGSIIFSFFNKDLFSFQNMITLCKRAGRFFIKVRTQESGIDFSIDTPIGLNVNEIYNISFIYKNENGLVLKVNDEEFVFNQPVPELEVNKGLFTAYTGTTPEFRLYDFNIEKINK